MRYRSITGKEFVVTKYCVDSESGRLPAGWTVRLLILGSGSRAAEIFWPLYEYMVANWSKSDSWQVGVARSIGLFWDYCKARINTIPTSWTKQKREREIFRGFAAALLNGTATDSEDPLDLHWHPQSLDFAKRTISAIEQFALWAAIELDHHSPNSALSQRRASSARTIVDIAVSNRRRGFSLLGYLRPNVSTSKSIVDLPVVSSGFNRENDRAISFPPAYVEAVLWDGFIRPGRNGDSLLDFNVRDMMIFLLQGYGGLREHEPFHLWVEDITEDPLRAGHASVFLFHPENGLAFMDGEDGRQKRTTRRVKLKEEFLLTPRTRGVGSYRVGWKNSKVQTKDQYAVVYWTDPIASALFWQLYLHYVAFRTYMMAKRHSLMLPPHPFLFVSEREARGSENGVSFIGAPASIESYETSLRRAVKSVGLKSEKDLGTTSQGLRHLYAYTLRALGVSSKVLQEGLRHRNPFSQDVYGNPLPSDINAQINASIAQSRGRLPKGLALERTFKWIEERYPQYRTEAGGLL